MTGLETLEVLVVVTGWLTTGFCCGSLTCLVALVVAISWTARG